MNRDGHNPKASPLKSVDQAQQFLLQHAKPLADSELVTLDQALDRVLAAPLVSPIDVPPWDNSAMDGYAIRSDDLSTTPPSCLEVSQRIAAGATGGTALEPGSAARIFTGAPIPPGADTVVVQEVCKEAEGRVTIDQATPGANIRRAGEDTARGTTILAPGTRLAPQHLGLIASVGIAEVSVYRRLKVAIFASGDELTSPGEPLGPGKIYNSNRWILGGLLQRLGCEVIDLGQVEDRFEATCDALSRGALQADLVLASGGVSVGEEDHVKPAVEALGSLDLWKIAIRPGKPLAFGHIDSTPFIGAPGNPVSLFVTFCLFARPFILTQQGLAGERVLPAPIIAKAGFDWERPLKRREYARARWQRDGQGQAVVSLYPSRSSGVIQSLTWANGLAVIPEQTTIAAGDEVEFLPFKELLS